MLKKMEESTNFTAVDNVTTIESVTARMEERVSELSEEFSDDLRVVMTHPEVFKEPKHDIHLKVDVVARFTVCYIVEM